MKIEWNPAVALSQMSFKRKIFLGVMVAVVAVVGALFIGGVIDPFGVETGVVIPTVEGAEGAGSLTAP